MPQRFRITHVGSLPRGETLAHLLVARERGAPADDPALAAEAEARIAHVLDRQREAGIDVMNDGEQGRAGFQTYVSERMEGFGGESDRMPPDDLIRFPDLAVIMRRRMGPEIAKVRNAPKCVGPVRYRSADAVKAECARLASGLLSKGLSPADGFLTAPSPGIVATTLQNAHYASHADYVEALAGELRHEYAAILEAGFTLQIDAPDLAMERCTQFREVSDEDFLAAANQHVDALNGALEGLPRERIRLHCCWGNWDGPHLHDIAMAKVLPVLYRAKVGALSAPLANPRHAHEYEAFEAHPLPDHLAFLPGVIDTTCNYVEHPKLIAARIAQAVAVTGDPARVLPSTDCGFGTFAGYEFVAESVVWAKLAALREGADLAASRL